MKKGGPRGPPLFVHDSGKQRRYAGTLSLL